VPERPLWAPSRCNPLVEAFDLRVAVLSPEIDIDERCGLAVVRMRWQRLGDRGLELVDRLVERRSVAGGLNCSLKE
jgi:hypothetical protein